MGTILNSHHIPMLGRGITKRVRVKGNFLLCKAVWKRQQESINASNRHNETTGSLDVIVVTIQVAMVTKEILKKLVAVERHSPFIVSSTLWLYVFFPKPTHIVCLQIPRQLELLRNPTQTETKKVKSRTKSNSKCNRKWSHNLCLCWHWCSTGFVVKWTNTFFCFYLFIYLKGTMPFDSVPMQIMTLMCCTQSL